jgi:cystathionine beta-synthase
MTQPLPPLAENILETIGNTPLTRISCFDTGLCSLYLKLESQNPGGSIKDRIAKSMIEAAEKSGQLKPGGTLVEATAGNTGLGLALVAARKGYRLILVVPDKMSLEKIAHLRAYGAEVIVTRSDVGKGHPEYYQDYAQVLAEEKDAFYVNQFGNPANPLAHETGTAPEIWQQMEQKVDAIVCGVGSGGTITGMSRFLGRHSPATEIILADPKGSILAEYIDTGKVSTEAGSWLVEGIGEDFVPPIVDLSRVKGAYTISDQESFDTARDLLKNEGILAGSSSGTLIAAAIRYCKEQTAPKRVVTFVCDSGSKYLSKMLSDHWMAEEGLLSRPRAHDLRDIITRPHTRGETVFVGPEDKLLTAHNKMKQFGISQLPVLKEGHLIGIVDESDMLTALLKEGSSFHQKIAQVMTSKVKTLQVNAPLSAVKQLLAEGLTPVILENDKFIGLITRSDVINHLRLTHQKET